MTGSRNYSLSRGIHRSKSSAGSISGTMYLEEYGSERWTSVTSWNIKGIDSVFLSKTYMGTSGVKYCISIVVTNC